jgi:Leucine-rich repeat (LRR) protein
MRKNNLSSLAEIPKYLGGLQGLRKLGLSENPLAEYSKYRLVVVKALPQIEELDNVSVYDDRRKVEGVSLEELIGGG